MVPVRVLRTLDEEGTAGVADEQCPDAVHILKHSVDSEGVPRRLDNRIRIFSEEVS